MKKRDFVILGISSLGLVGMGFAGGVYLSNLNRNLKYTRHMI